MKIKYTFPVTSIVRLPASLRFRIADRVYELLAPDDGLWSSLSVICDGYPSEALPKIILAPKTIEGDAAGKPKAEIIFPEDPFWPAVSADVRTIEGMCCFYGLKQIDTASYDREWIPENAEETDLVQLYQCSRGRSAPVVSPEETFNLLLRSFSAVGMVRSLEVPLTFFRWGKLDVYEERYIEAIYDFFFVIEGLFGRGKFRSRDLIRAFRDFPKALAGYSQSSKGARRGDGKPAYLSR